MRIIDLIKKNGLFYTLSTTNKKGDVFFYLGHGATALNKQAELVLFTERDIYESWVKISKRDRVEFPWGLSEVKLTSSLPVEGEESPPLDIAQMKAFLEKAHYLNSNTLVKIYSRQLRKKWVVPVMRFLREVGSGASTSNQEPETIGTEDQIPSEEFLDR